jgi:hypothetical protein
MTRTSPPRARSTRRRRRLVAKSITYTSTQRPHDRPRELTVNITPGEVMDTGYAAAIVAVRTGMPLAEVSILTIAATGERP